MREEKSVHRFDHRVDHDRIGSARRAGRSLAAPKTEVSRPGRERILEDTLRLANTTSATAEGNDMRFYDDRLTGRAGARYQIR